MYDYDMIKRTNLEDSGTYQLRDWMLSEKIYDCEGVSPFSCKGLFNAAIDRPAIRR